MNLQAEDISKPHIGLVALDCLMRAMDWLHYRIGTLSNKTLVLLLIVFAALVVNYAAGSALILGALLFWFVCVARRRYIMRGIITYALIIALYIAWQSPSVHMLLTLR